MTGLLRRLQAQGLLAREAHPGDARRAVLRLTRRGRRLNTARDGTVEGAVERALRDMGARDRACARRALEAIAGQVGA